MVRNEQMKKGEKMTKKEIESVVRLTVKSLKKEGMMKSLRDVIYRDTCRKLYSHFNEMYSEEVAKALNDVKTDLYFSIIPLYFSKRMTHEQIAEQMSVEVSTITRNKKRLCIEIGSLMDQEEKE